MKLEEIADVIAAKGYQHPELARGLTWPGFRRICDREGIALRISQGNIPRQAQLVPFLGSWTIVISRNVPYRRHTYLGAHELGHLWLHHDHAHERWERVYNMGATWEADPREDDAEAFATLVLMGPKRTESYRRPQPTLVRPGIHPAHVETRIQAAQQMVSRIHRRR